LSDLARNMGRRGVQGGRTLDGALGRFEHERRDDTAVQPPGAR
jgi:hypothetical protein